MTISIEASDEVATIRARTVRPSHHDRAPMPLMVLDPDQLDIAALALAERIRGIRYAHSCATYVYVDHEMTVYAIAEEKPTSQAWVRDHFAWLVGVYDLVRRPGLVMLKPSAEGIRADLAEHLEDLKR
jgi:hypothetical protein